MVLFGLFLRGAFALTNQQEAILTCLRAQLGKPFIWGGNGPNSFDCSGLVRYCQEAAGITGLPRTSLLQSQVGKVINCSEAQVGDLIFFYEPVSHDGTFSSNVSIIHAIDEEKPVVEYPNIFTNSFWGPRINRCTRNWNDNPAIAPPTPAKTAIELPSRSPAPTVLPTDRATAPLIPGLTQQQSEIVTCLEMQLGKPYLPQGEDP
jgi:hypothetical protein